MGVRNRLMRFFHNDINSEFEPFETDFFGLKYRGNFNNLIDWNVFYFGAYSPEELRLMERVLSKMDRPIVVDVGANIGHHTLFAAKYAGQVIAVEPFGEVANKIRQKIEDNGLSNVVICNLAFGEAESNSTYYAPSGPNQGTGSLLHSQEGGKTSSLVVPVRRGDSVLADLGVTRVHFVKIDAESFEPFVLMGLRSTLVNSRPVVFFEWSKERDDLLKGVPHSTLFPPDYLFFRFVGYRPFFWVLNRPGFELHALTDEWPQSSLEYYVLAVPRESLHLIEESLGSSGGSRSTSASGRQAPD